MSRIVSIFIIQFIFFISLLNAAKVTLSVDKNVLSIDEQTVLHVKVSGITPEELPTIKNLENFNYQYIGSSSNLTIINGKINSEKGFNFLISPKKIGTYKIGPAIVISNGKKYVSNTITLKVKKSKIQSALKNLIFAKVYVNKKKVVINEQIIITLKIFKKIEVTDLKLIEPEFKGFLVYKLGKPHSYREIINGEEFTVTEVKYSLIPTVTGKFKIGPFILHGVLINDNFDAFFKNPFSFNIPFTKNFKISSNSISITVKSLKKKVYAVGDYTVTFNIDKLKTNIGDTINLTIKIKGKGDLRLSNSIKIKKINGLKFYYDKSQFKILKKDDGIYTEKTEKIAIVPEKSGVYKIPSLSLLFYNPKKKKYEYIKIPEVKIKVAREQKQSLKIVENKSKYLDTSKKNNEFDSIFTDINLENQNINFSIYWFLPGFFFLFIFYFYRFFSENKNKIHKEIKQKKAFRILKNNLKEVEDIHKINTELKRYFSNKFQIKESATYEEIINFLKDYLKIDDLKEIKDVFSKIEQLIFSGVSIKKEDIEILKKEIINMVKKIENGKK